MKKTALKKSAIKDAVNVFAMGGVALLMSAVAGLLAYLSITIFCGIPSMNGYRAVCGFVIALVAAAAALGVVYTCGAWVVIKGKFGR